MTWETVIGLEVHAQLKTCSKLFSGSATEFGSMANTQTSFIDAALPGVLPVLNQKAVEMAVQFGLAINGKVNNFSYFERKNYFYPDLPKGYQISQFQRPIVSNGHLIISLNSDQQKRIDITRAHLEEDAGKSIHDINGTHTGIDLNRAGNPLLEIVTAPCIFSAEEAVLYLKTLHQLLRFLEICDGNMQEGSFRCDVNLSIRRLGSSQLGTRTELKNLNSFRFIEKAIIYEQLRHQEVLESGQTIIQETRLYCPDSNTTRVMRSKENENDYRYFPDPDLLPIQITQDELKQFADQMPPLPSILREQLVKNDNLTQDDADFLLLSPAHFKFYQAVKKYTQAPSKLILNWLKGRYAALLNDHNLSFENPPVSAEKLAELLNRINDQRISVKNAKSVFSKLIHSNATVDEIITAEGFQNTQNNQALQEMIINIINAHPQQVAEYRAGKDKLKAFFVGQVMKQTKGQASPEEINRLLDQYLTN